MNVQLQVMENRGLEPLTSIAIRFTHKGYRFLLTKLGHYEDQIALKHAQTICDRIALDIASGNFTATNNGELALKYNPNAISSFIPKSVAEFIPPKPKKLLEVWDRYVDSLVISERTKNDHYLAVRRMVAKANPDIYETSWFVNAKYAPSTFNDRLSYLKSCLSWAVEEEIVDRNPYLKLKKRNGAKPRIKPFTQDEMKAIINAFRTNQFCSKKSAFKHSHYADFVEFMFLTGVRTSEAIGLQAKHLDFHKGEIVICSALARGDKGQTASKHRVRKETKTGNIRYLTMTPRLKEMLEEKCKNLSPDNLVFTSPKGLAIDDHNFQRRQWKTVLDGLGIEYRKPYTTRHTLASMAIEENIPLTGVAYLLGHKNTTMVTKTYGHMINRPSLPNFNP